MEVPGLQIVQKLLAFAVELVVPIHRQPLQITMYMGQREHLKSITEPMVAVNA
jgi:hypothetical protein